MNPEATGNRPFRDRALRGAVGVWTSAAVFSVPLLIYLFGFFPLRRAEFLAIGEQTDRVRSMLDECRPARGRPRTGVPSPEGCFTLRTHHTTRVLAEIEEVFPSRPPLHQIPEILRQLAEIHGIRRARWAPERLTTAGPVGVLPWHAELEGSFDDLSAFIQHLERTVLAPKVTELHLIVVGADTYRLDLRFDSFYSAEPGP